MLHVLDVLFVMRDTDTAEPVAIDRDELEEAAERIGRDSFHPTVRAAVSASATPAAS
jgi:hypothetical protein